jgi:hypothetical protein
LQASNEPYTLTARFNGDTATDVLVKIGVLPTGTIYPLTQTGNFMLSARFIAPSRTFMISSAPGIPASVTVCRGDGKLIPSLSNSSVSGELAVSFANQAAGIYLVRIRSNGESKTLRLLNSRLSR